MLTETTLMQTTKEIAAKFNALAQQEKWFEIQDELFADDVRSIEPAQATYLKNASGKDTVRKKGEDWVARIDQVHKLSTTHPVVSGNHFAIGRYMDINIKGIGNVKIDEIIVYEVKNGQIISEQFFY